MQTMFGNPTDRCILFFCLIISPADLRQSYAYELPDHWPQDLEAGVNWGVATNYPNDIGLDANTQVFAVEDFEKGSVTIEAEDDRYNLNTNVVSTQAFTCKYSGEHRWTKGYNGPTARYQIPEEVHQGERPTYFVRMYLMFDDGFRPQYGESGVGVKGFGIFSDPTNSSSPGTPCDGTNWDNAQTQFFGCGPSSTPLANDGYLWVGHLYSYNPAPETTVSSLGTIKVSAPPVSNEPYQFSSYADPFSYIDFGGWHCYEMGLYLNTPGEDDGEARFWIDGVLQSRVTNMRYRDIEDLYLTAMHRNLLSMI